MKLHLIGFSIQVTLFFLLFFFFFLNHIHILRAMVENKVISIYISLVPHLIKDTA